MNERYDDARMLAAIKQVSSELHHRLDIMDERIGGLVRDDDTRQRFVAMVNEALGSLADTLREHQREASARAQEGADRLARIEERLMLQYHEITARQSKSSGGMLAMVKSLEALEVKTSQAIREAELQAERKINEVESRIDPVADRVNAMAWAVRGALALGSAVLVALGWVAFLATRLPPDAWTVLLRSSGKE